MDSVHKGLVVENLFQTLIADLLQEHHGVLTYLAPEIMVDVAEEAFAFAIPYPPEVLTHFLKWLELFGELGRHGEIVPGGMIGITYLKFHFFIFLIYIILQIESNNCSQLCGEGICFCRALWPQCSLFWRRAAPAIAMPKAS